MEGVDIMTFLDNPRTKIYRPQNVTHYTCDGYWAPLGAGQHCNKRILLSNRRMDKDLCIPCLLRELPNLLGRVSDGLSSERVSLWTILKRGRLSLRAAECLRCRKSYTGSLCYHNAHLCLRCVCAMIDMF